MRKSYFITKTLALICAAVLFLGIFSGCGASEQGSGQSASSASPAASTGSGQPAPAAAERDKLSIMVQINYSEAPNDSNEVEKMIEEFSNTDLKIIWVPVGNYNEKVNLAITSNDLPNAISILKIKDPVFVNAARAGMFWDIKEKMPELKTLNANYNPDMLKNASIDGQLYGLPRARPLTRNGIILRKDWLKNVGLENKQPATLDDLYTIIKAFATQDPDKNGKNDTNGILVGVESDGKPQGCTLETLDVAFGGGNGWEQKDGKLIPTFTTDVHIKTLNYLKKLYDEKLMNQDFATVQPSQFYEILDKERAGFFFQTLTDAHERLDNIVKVVQARDPELAKLQAVDAKAEIFDTIYQIQSADGKIRASTQDGFNGVWAFSKTSNKTDADLMKILSFFDKMDTPDGQAIIEWGKEGLHWSKKDGVPTMTGDSLVFSREVQPYWQLFCTNRETDRSSIKGYVAPMYTKVYKEMGSLLPYAVFNPIVPLVSDTYSTNGAILDKIINDARSKYIMGVIDEAGWKAAVDQWRQQGGDKMIEEYTQQYQKYGVN